MHVFQTSAAVTPGVTPTGRSDACKGVEPLTCSDALAWRRPGPAAAEDAEHLRPCSGRLFGL